MPGMDMEVSRRLQDVQKGAHVQLPSALRTDAFSWKKYREFLRNPGGTAVVTGRAGVGKEVMLQMVHRMMNYREKWIDASEEKEDVLRILEQIRAMGRARTLQNRKQIVIFRDVDRTVLQKVAAIRDNRVPLVVVLDDPSKHIELFAHAHAVRVWENRKERSRREGKDAVVSFNMLADSAENAWGARCSVKSALEGCRTLQEAGFIAEKASLGFSVGYASKPTGSRVDERREVTAGWLHMRSSSRWCSSVENKEHAQGKMDTPNEKDRTDPKKETSTAGSSAVSLPCQSMHILFNTPHTSRSARLYFSPVFSLLVRYARANAQSLPKWLKKHLSWVVSGLPEGTHRDTVQQILKEAVGPVGAKPTGLPRYRYKDGHSYYVTREVRLREIGGE